ncbi:helix-turn-helix domain-containing protein [Billgrantia lactosivorans]|uniref:helix-turn-helix domain-containing protein n=1 Tax=Billgrantia lactosivorans TaxID=2185141 RepID=UPI000DAE5B76|nr:helix-turn-helix transcriptional regulator [Halomonas lactosivorans]
MSDPSADAALDWPGLMPALAACVASLGEQRFDEQLLDLLRRAVGIEQCMIFAFDDSDEVDCLLAANERAPRIADHLAELYTGGLFRQDPNYQRLRQLLKDNGGESAAAEVTPMQAEAMPEAYRSHLFAFPDLIDKVSLTVPAPSGAFYLNLYRGSGAGPFTNADLANLNAMAPLLASLIRRHYRYHHGARPTLQRPSREEAAVLATLSERERQLCLYLLRGHTLKTAAAELDIALSTAETYRKRAYAKLGVPSKARLVALCR